MRMPVQSLVSLSGLRICHELWCRLQMCLWSGVAVAVAAAAASHCGSYSIPSRGTSIHHRYSAPRAPPKKEFKELKRPGGSISIMHHGNHWINLLFQLLYRVLGHILEGLHNFWNWQSIKNSASLEFPLWLSRNESDKPLRTRVRSLTSFSRFKDPALPWAVV